MEAWAAAHRVRDGRAAPKLLRRSVASSPFRLLTPIRLVVKAGAAPNASAFIEAAVRDCLRERRRQRVCAAYAEASRDPVFIAEMAQIDRVLDVTVGHNVSDRV